ncbi:MAG TPA: type II toxin-antitoxin system VapC family toxin [Gemmatimonadaceae bacterium]|jgi:predicted nucleic acid-binding protein|nr:type II toxin-antitoxin system VapC family toxin [Gemmatimonadaceae bacterium]
MRRYALDTNLYIAGDRDPARAEELVAFYASFVPVTYLHAVVIQELLLGAVDRRRRAAVRSAYIRPFESRRRIITPTTADWIRSGEVVRDLVEKKLLSPGGFGRSFLNDVLLAVSCRSAGITLVTENAADFALIQRVERFEFVRPWPEVMTARGG